MTEMGELFFLSWCRRCFSAGTVENAIFFHVLFITFESNLHSDNGLASFICIDICMDRHHNALIYRGTLVKKALKRLCT